MVRSVMLALGFVLLLSLTLPAAPNAPLRIGLLLRQDNIQVSGEGRCCFLNPTGKRIALAQPGEVWQVSLIPPGVWSAPPDKVPLKPQPEDEVYLYGPDGRVAASSALPLVVKPLEGRLVAHGVAADHWDKQSVRTYRGHFEICRASHKMSLINLVDLESYLKGVVPSEMSVTYPLEALKAQAVAARTECLSCLRRHLVDGADMCNTQHCQVYGGASSEDPRTNEAVTATAGQVVTYNGGLARCVYSAVCGGHTENCEDVWGTEPLPYLRGQPDFPAGGCEFAFPLDEAELSRYLSGTPGATCYQPAWSKPEYFRWQVEKTRAELEQTLAAAGIKVGTLLGLEPISRGVSGRIKSLRVRGTAGEVMIGPELAIRKALGSLRSSNFIVTVTPGAGGTPERFTFTGAGWGHGVGMCQVGAVGMAAAGADYRQILGFYFPGTSISDRWRIARGRWQGE